MKGKNLRKLGATSAIIVGLGSSLCMGQSFTTIAGCTPSDFVLGGPSNQIATAGTTYSPKCLRVKIGAAVTIQASQHHPLAAMPNINGATNPFSDNGRFVFPQTRIMNTPGLFGYFCEAHGDSEGDGMAGAILVE